MKKFIICCARNEPLTEAGGSAAGVKNASQVLDDSAVKFVFLKDLGFSKKILLWVSVIFSRTGVIAHDIESCLFFGLKRPHLVFHSQGDTVSEMRMFDNPKLHHLFYYWVVERLAFFLCKTITTPTLGAFDYVVKAYPLWGSYLRRKLTKPLYGLHTSNKTPRPHKTINNSSRLELLTVSSFLSSKNIASLPYLISSLFKDYDFKWTIIGRGPQENELRNQIEANNLSRKVILVTEFISDDEMNDYYKNADIFLMNHKVAICDRAIGQAMYHSLGLILSKTPSNIELNIFNNILFWSDINSFSEVLDYNLYHEQTYKSYEYLWSENALKTRYKQIFNIGA